MAFTHHFRTALIADLAASTYPWPLPAVSAPPASSSLPTPLIGPEIHPTRGINFYMYKSLLVAAYRNTVLAPLAPFSPSPLPPLPLPPPYHHRTTATTPPRRVLTVTIAAPPLHHRHNTSTRHPHCHHHCTTAAQPPRHVLTVTTATSPLHHLHATSSLSPPLHHHCITSTPLQHHHHSPATLCFQSVFIHIKVVMWFDLPPRHLFTTAPRPRLSWTLMLAFNYTSFSCLAYLRNASSPTMPPPPSPPHLAALPIEREVPPFSTQSIAKS
ncbi:hypothetical protein BCR43DRAFT_509496 [Syncephalastrum racemosum]|uniref:Uncharacterized protein n=1 Tax=Syncephalastrum racemosum TaxID=13706 RepID=A0A1X2HRZ9_SYNRA|nr:hypothetical protein BCR43DRAFT_509496 [Syncephalastrum racemosum]